MRWIVMILSLCLLVYLHKLNLLLMARGTLSFRKLREEVICGHNITLSERESFSELKTNVLTVMLCLNWVNKESGDKQTWLRGYMNEVTICLSPCLSAHLSVCLLPQQRCSSVVWRGLDLQQQTTPHTHFITPTPSPSALLTNHPWEPLDVTCCSHQI